MQRTRETPSGKTKKGTASGIRIAYRFVARATENVSGTGAGSNYGYVSGKLRRSVGDRGGDYED